MVFSRFAISFSSATLLNDFGRLQRARYEINELPRQYKVGREYYKSFLPLGNTKSISCCFFRAIINHFSPKIESWLTSQSLSTPSEDQILEVVRKNYDSLTLKLQDSLDQFERYSDKPRHSAFFTSMMRGVVNDTKLNINYATLDLQVILQDFSAIS